MRSLEHFRKDSEEQKADNKLHDVGLYVQSNNDHEKPIGEIGKAATLVASGLLTNLTIEQIGSAAKSAGSWAAASIGKEAKKSETTEKTDVALEAKDLKKLFADNEKRFDLNGNGFVSRRELNKVIADKDVRGADAQLAALLRFAISDLEELSNDEWFDENSGVTEDDMAELDKLARDAKGRSKDETKLVDEVNEQLKDFYDITKRSNRQLYATTDPLKSILPEAIKQQHIGDCYFLAPLASLAAADPQLIKDMIEDNGDGTYTVIFPAEPDKPITVSAPTDAELLRFNAGGEHGVWASVLEKAYGKAIGGDNAQKLDGGGYPDDVLRLFTDRKGDCDWLARTSEDDLHRDLKKAFKEKRAVACGTREDYREGKLLKGDRIVQQHAYSILAYDANTYTVTIRNPWAEREPQNEDGKTRDGKDDGIFKMSLREFKHTFEEVYYQG